MHAGTALRYAKAPAARTETNPWPVRIFVLSLALPWQVQVGPAVLTMHRFVLLIALVPCLWAMLSGRCGRLRLADVSVLMFCAFASVSMAVLSGVGPAIEPSVILFVETVGGYLLARAFIRSPEDFRAMAVLFVGVTLSMLPWALLEAITGRNVALDLFRTILPTIPDGFEGFRMGLRRAQGVYEHPILFGLNAGAAFALAYLVAGDRQPIWSRSLIGAAVGVTAGLSMSSAPLGSLVLQFALIAWNGATRAVPRRWTLLWVALALALLIVDGLSRRSILEIYISYFSFSPYNGWYRLLIWQYGTAAVMTAPWFGIGFAEWAHPAWMTSSVDNFWLAMAMRHGLPAAICLLAGPIAACAAVSFRKVDHIVYRYRLAYLAVVAGFILVGCTVHLWGSSHVLFMFMIGSGLWIADWQMGESRTHPATRSTVTRGGAGVAGLRRRVT